MLADLSRGCAEYPETVSNGSATTRLELVGLEPYLHYITFFHSVAHPGHSRSRPSFTMTVCTRSSHSMSLEHWIQPLDRSSITLPRSMSVSSGPVTSPVSSCFGSSHV